MGTKSKTAKAGPRIDTKAHESKSASPYTRDAEQKCAAFHKRTGRIIKLLTVQEILDEEHVQKM